jgi:hypothetical protein
MRHSDGQPGKRARRGSGTPVNSVGLTAATQRGGFVYTVWTGVIGEERFAYRELCAMGAKICGNINFFLRTY